MRVMAHIITHFNAYMKTKGKRKYIIVKINLRYSIKKPRFVK